MFTQIGFVGYVIAKVVSSLIGMGSALLDKVAVKLKITDTAKVVSILQKVVFIVIIIPFLIQALNALEINAISEPANNVLSTIQNGFKRISAPLWAIRRRHLVK